MRAGYRTTVELLEKDRQGEESLAAAFDHLAAGAEPNLAKILSDIARRCMKNAERIAQLRSRLDDPAYDINLRCPVCGWAIPFGKDPTPGMEVKCELCSIWFKLLEENGDYRLQNMGRKEAKKPR